MFEILRGEALKGYKEKNLIQNNKKGINIHK